MKILITAVAVALISTTSVSAHVLITDTTLSQGAILHIIPDDDPIAGQESTFYFDTQANFLHENSRATLTITSASGPTNTVATTIDGTLITARYTFPVQGVYQLTYTITSKDTVYSFEQSQRVSRGVLGSALDTPSYVWAEMLAVVSAGGIVGLIVVAYKRRHAIAKQSTL